MTCLRPDHTSSMAQTFTSTRPWPSANSRTTFSFRSVGTPDARLGQAIQSAPAGVVRGCSEAQRAANRSLVVQKQTMTSYGPAPRRRITDACAASSESVSGAPSSSTVAPGVTPSLRANGVPEYPATRSSSHGRPIAMYRVCATVAEVGNENEEYSGGTMSRWEITNPQRLELDGEVGDLEVWLASGKLHVVGTEGPARIEVTKVGTKGIDVELERGRLSVRHRMPTSWWQKLGPFWWFGSGRRRYLAHITVAVPPTAHGNLTLISGSVVASGMRRGATVSVTSGSITLMGLGGSVSAKTVSGSIQAMGVAGDLSMSTISGEISLAESSAERVQARTISGSVTCDLDNPFTREVR